jgi:hypothetical protein
MTENIAYNLDVGSGINLPAGVTVAKRMRTNHFGWNARQPGVVPDTIPYGRTGYGLVGHVFAQEKGTD